MITRIKLTNFRTTPGDIEVNFTSPLCPISDGDYDMVFQVIKDLTIFDRIRFTDLYLPCDRKEPVDIIIGVRSRDGVNTTYFVSLDRNGILCESLTVNSVISEYKTRESEQELYLHPRLIYGIEQELTSIIYVSRLDSEADLGGLLRYEGEDIPDIQRFLVSIWSSLGFEYEGVDISDNSLISRGKNIPFRLCGDGCIWITNFISQLFIAGKHGDTIIIPDFMVGLHPLTCRGIVEFFKTFDKGQFIFIDYGKCDCN